MKKWMLVGLIIGGSINLFFIPNYLKVSKPYWDADIILAIFYSIGYFGAYPAVCVAVAGMIALAKRLLDKI